MSDKLSTVVPATGEIVEVDVSTPEAVIDSYKYINDYIKSLEGLKKKLQTRATEVVNSNGTYEHNGYMLRVSSVQRMQYDKFVLREVFDEDTLDLFLEPAKTRIDDYLKEHLEELGDGSTRLRESMIAIGNPYRVVKLERLDRGTS